ncbi:MAG TPA: hypothetical protein VF220_06235 [Nitrososphaeraceae archaeon]
MLSITQLEIPTIEQIKSLNLEDLAIMNELSISFRKKLLKYISIDPFTSKDPFEVNDDYNYYIILNKSKSQRVVSIMAEDKNTSNQLPWNIILDNKLTRLQISKNDASELKYELMPKDTNNFYSYRISTKIAGYIMFAFQICGLH